MFKLILTKKEINLRKKKIKEIYKFKLKFTKSKI